MGISRVSFMIRLLAVCALALCGMAAFGLPDRPVKNLVTDYGAVPGRDIAGVLQQAVHEVGAAGGGTILIPGTPAGWIISRPVLVGYPNITITGEGAATRIQGGATFFVLGIKEKYPQAIGTGHYPLISGEAGVLDASVKTPHYGLRTFDGTVRAAGYFPACPLAHGGRILAEKDEYYWKQYERGVGKPTYWEEEPQYTINLAVRNNGAGVMKGVICGVGPGGVTPPTTRGTIADPLTIWTIESDPATGKNLAFKFRVHDAQGKESIRTLLLSAEPAGQGTHRISVQLDFTTGACRAWFSTSREAVVPSVLTATMELGEGYRFARFQYGAFRLGAVVDNPFAGTPSDGTPLNGDWTYCGLALFKTPQFAVGGNHDTLGAPQVMAQEGQGTPTDTDRYFPRRDDPTAVTSLPLVSREATQLVAYQNCRGCDDLTGYGYWLPHRPLAPMDGTFGVEKMALFAHSSNSGTPIAIGEARHVRLVDLYEGGGGFHGVGSWDCHPPNSLAELTCCRLMGFDAMYYGKSQTLKMSNISGGSSEADFRLVGCRGEITSVLITGFLKADYYLKHHAGPYGGELAITYFCIDNEGIAFVPQKACFYAEPSLNPGPEGNKLVFRGGIYSGFMPPGSAVVELADPPGIVPANVTASLSIDYIDLMSNTKRPCESIVRCKSARWSGRVLNVESHWYEAGLSHGLINYQGPAGQCKIVTYQNDTAKLPSTGAWIAGCHLIRMPTQRDPATGAWRYDTYRCVKSGVYGTATEPQWEKVPAAAISREKE